MIHVRKLRSNGIFLFAALCAAAMLGMMPAGAARAAVYGGTYTYAVDDQSMWGDGAGTAINYSQFFGTSWNKSATVGDVYSYSIWNPFGDDPTVWAGGEVTAHSAGRIGVDVGASVNSGTVDISQQSSVQLNAPEIINSSQQLIVSSTALLGTGNIATQSPTVSAYADLVLELEADVSAKLCVVGCTDYSKTLVNLDAHPELLAVNRDNDGQVRVLGVDTGGLPLSTSIGPVDVTLSLPNIATSGTAPPQPLASSGTSEFIDISLDIANLASTSLGVPLSGSLWPFSYSLFSAGLGLDLEVYQDFSFTAGTPTITLNVAETGFSYSFLAGQDSPVIDPMGFDLLNISSTIDFSGILSNDTGLNLSPYAFMDILSASAFGYSVGPVYSWDSTFGTFPMSLFDNDIQIDFAALAGPSFQVAIADDPPNSVPEPGTMLLVGSGLLSLAGFRRRRGNDREDFAL